MNQKAVEWARPHLRGQNFMTPDTVNVDFVPNSNGTMVYELCTDHSGVYLFNQVPYGVVIVDCNGKNIELSGVFSDQIREVAHHDAMEYINQLVP